MEWREWVWNRLRTHLQLTSYVPEASMYAAGSVQGVPVNKPFVVIRFEETVVELNDGDQPEVQSRFLVVWAHDEPGSYVRIDTILGLVSTALVGDVPEAITCIAQGGSGDLADDAYGTITRNATFKCIGGAQ